MNRTSCAAPPAGFASRSSFVINRSKFPSTTTHYASLSEVVSSLRNASLSAQRLINSVCVRWHCSFRTRKRGSVCVCCSECCSCISHCDYYHPEIATDFLAMIFVLCYCLDLIHHVRVWVLDHARLQIHLLKKCISPCRLTTNHSSSK